MLIIPFSYSTFHQGQHLLGLLKLGFALFLGDYLQEHCDHEFHFCLQLSYCSLQMGIFSHGLALSLLVSEAPQRQSPKASYVDQHQIKDPQMSFTLHFQQF